MLRVIPFAGTVVVISVQQSAAVSIADELAKLHELRASNASKALVLVDHEC